MATRGVLLRHRARIPFVSIVNDHIQIKISCWVKYMKQMFSNITLLLKTFQWLLIGKGAPLMFK
jgi:hypothetical protein